MLDPKGNAVTAISKFSAILTELAPASTNSDARLDGIVTNTDFPEGGKFTKLFEFEDEITVSLNSNSLVPSILYVPSPTSQLPAASSMP